MRIPKKIIFPLFFLFYGSLTFSQKISENKFYSEFKYIFRLDSSQQRVLLQKNKPDTAWILNTMVDSFHRDSIYNYTKLPYGTYLTCHVYEHQVSYATYHRHPFALDVWGVNTKNYVIVKDDKGKVIEDARVSLLNNKVCPFSIGMASYELPRIPNGTIVKVEYQGNFDYILVNPSYYKPPAYQNSYPSSRSSILPGYIALNQPRYKQNDTLKFKAFFVYNDGTYYNERISVWLHSDYDGKQKKIGVYRRQTPGAYFGAFVLGDTLIADHTYTLIFRNSLEEEIKRTNFALENYELKKNTYELSMTSSLIYPGQKIMLVAKARDANNLPVMDGYVKINIRLASVEKVHTDRFFVPNAWFRTLYRVERELDPSGYTVIELPDTLFRNFDGVISVEAQFTDEDNELVTRSTSFHYQNKNQVYGIAYHADTLKADYFFNSIAASRTMKLVTVYYNYTRESKIITTPFAGKIDYAAVKYELYYNDTLVADYNCPLIGQEIGIFGKRTFDSVFISLYNPLKIPVHYEIYKNKKRVAEGRSERLEYKVADLTTESYYIVWGHNYMGALRNNYHTQAFHFQEKKLNVEISQPEEIYPGQEVDVSITVTDARKKPAQNINLTAYSVNSQFGEIPLPDVPYLGLIRNDEPLHFTQPNFQVYNLSTTLPVKAYHLKALHLYKNEMYQLAYASKAKTTLRFKIPTKDPEYAVYVFKQHRLYGIISIMLDENIITHSGNSLPNRFSFRTRPGKHVLKVRLNDMLVNFGEVNFDDSTKYILGINLDSVTRGDTTRLIPGKFDAKEYAAYMDQTLLLHIDEPFDTLRIYQDGRLCFFGDRSSTFRKIMIGSDNFSAFTVFGKGGITVKLSRQYEQDILFEPGKLFYMNKKEVRSYPLELKKAVNLLYFNNTQNGGYNLLLFNQVYVDPDIVVPDTAKKNITAVKEKKTRQRPFIYYRDYRPAFDGPRNTLAIYQKSGYIPYKRAWLISHRKDSLSVIGNFGNYINYADSGTYDLILLNDTAVSISRNIYLPADGTLHLFTYASSIMELDPDSIWDYEQVVKKLTKAPKRMFTDTPITIRAQVMRVNKTNNAYCTLTGNVLDALFLTPIDFTTIIAEIDGVFKGGALTNQDGDFEINFLPPGNYMLKIRANGYRYQVMYNLEMERGIEKNVRLRLLHLEDSVRLDNKGNVVYEWNFGDSRDTQYTHKSNGNMAYSDEVQYEKMAASPTSANIYAQPNRSINYVAGMAAGVISRESADLYDVNVVTSNDGFVDPSTPIEKINADKMQQHLNDLAQEAGANRIRNVYRDYGYWVPNLLTNQNGVARFNVRFPDNITSWKTIVPAMNGNRQSGMTTMLTKSFKPLIGAMAVPSFLVAGDRISLKGKVINYTGNIQDVKINFSLNGITKRTYLAYVDRLATDTFSLTAGKAGDTLKTAFSLSMPNGYIDGEERMVPVKANGILISRSKYIGLIRDTSLQYIVDADANKATVFVHNSEIAQLKQEIEELKRYSYGCTEQTTSKLRALLAEKSIDEALKIRFTGDKEIRQLMKRLESMRNNRGTWGWWGNGQEDHWLTLYVVRTLNEARLAGYSNNIYTRAANRLEDELKLMNVTEQLDAMNILKDMDRRLPYDTFLTKMDYVNLDPYQKLLYVRLMQRLHKPYDIGDVTNLSRQMPNGALCWGAQVYNYKYDEAANTLLAFDILRKDSLGRNLLPNIKAYFGSDAFTRHTLARAGLISLYLNDWKEHHDPKENLFGEVTVNGTMLSAKDFPFSRTYRPNDTIRITHKGSESYANIITSRIETKPQPDATFFLIHSNINGHKDAITVDPGQVVALNVEVEVFRSSENVMLEIPLPAGFSYYAKPQGQGGYETHREYFNDRTSIFFTNLPRGKYSYTIQVVPKYTGTFNLPPAKVELMYYPEVRNNEVPKVVVVK